MQEESDAFDAAFNELKKKLKARYEEYHEVQNKISKERENYHYEAKSMNFKLVEPCDIVHINVGGEIVSTTRGTLTQVEKSLLGAMFSGRWEHSINRDSEGRVFLDFDPTSFKSVLRYLRERGLDKQRAEKEWLKERSRSASLDMLAGYLDLVDEPPTALFVPHFKEGFTRTRLNEVKDMLTGPCTADHTPIIADPGMVAGQVYYWKMMVTHPSLSWVYLGIIANTIPSHDSYCDATSYGWGGREGACQVYEAGAEKTGHGGWQRFTSGDQPVFQLDLTGSDGGGGTLSMWLPRLNKKFSLTGLSLSPTWYIHVNLFNPKTQVQLLPISNEEKRLLS